MLDNMHFARLAEYFSLFGLLKYICFMKCIGAIRFKYINDLWYIQMLSLIVFFSFQPPVGSVSGQSSSEEDIRMKPSKSRSVKRRLCCKSYKDFVQF